jgi:hypothetical protein
MTTSEYRTNRVAFPRAALEPYAGRWVAFSPDGQRIVASGETLERLEDQIAAAGYDPQAVVLEYLPGPDDDTGPDEVEFL